MAESSRFWTTNGVGDGSTDGYTQQEIYDFLRRVFVGDQEASQGVLKEVDYGLWVSGTASPLTVATGAAICYGFFYENTSNKTLTVTTPSVGTTGGRVNLKVDWAAQTVRATVELNTDGVADIPALVQTAGTRWDMPLATFTITTGGVITVTSARIYARYATEVRNEMLRDAAGLSVIGRAATGWGTVADITAGSDHTVLRRNGSSLDWGQVEGDWIPSDGVTTGKLASGGVGTEDVLDGAIGTALLGADAVDDTKLGNRAPQFYRRQGGSESDWSLAGVSTYIPEGVRIQAGSKAAAVGRITVTFPTAFAQKPLVLLTEYASTKEAYYHVDEVNVGSFSFYVQAVISGGDKMLWMAIGAK